MAKLSARVRELVHRLAGTFSRGRNDADLLEELRSHLEMASDAAAGDAGAADEASRVAVLRHGALAQAIEKQRDQRSLPWLEDLVSDLRYCGRQIPRSPGFAGAVVLALALGIGTTTATFSAIDGLLLEQLPVRNPDSLVSLMWNRSAQDGASPAIRDSGSADDVDPATGQPLFAAFSRSTFDLITRDAGSIVDVFAAASLWRLNVNVDHQAELRDGLLVSGGYYSILGIEALRGRTLQPHDDQPGAPPVAVISERYWRTRFGGDPHVVGRMLIVNRASVTIVGIAPPEFRGVFLNVEPQDITMPLVMAAQVGAPTYGRIQPNRRWLRLIGRPRSGLTPEQVRERLNGLFQDSVRVDLRQDEVRRLHVVPAGYGRTAQERQQIASVLLPAMGLATMLLLVAAFNVANLFVARASARDREMAMRVALGASRGRLVRLLLTEAIALATAGALVGIVCSKWGLDVLAATFDPADRQVFENLHLNMSVLSFTLLVALLTGIFFALAPLRRTRQLDPRPTGGSWPGSRHTNLGRILMVGQVALSLVLLTCAALFVQALRVVQAVDVGFATDRLLLFRVDAAPLGYQPTQFSLLHARIADELASVPGITAVTFSSWPLASGWNGRIANLLPVERSVAPEDTQGAVILVGPNYFPSYGIPVVAGRSFNARDDSPASRVAIINETLMRTYFGQENPVGRKIRADKDIMTIVGVVRDVRETDSHSPTLAALFVPFSQSPEGAAHFAVRTASDPAAVVGSIRRAVAHVDENLPLERVRTQTDQVAWRLSAERFYAKGSVFLGLMALVLASVGLFGLMSYLVNRRTREIGLRMALGARPRQVLWSILRESGALVLGGIVIGLVGAVWTSRLIASALHGVSPTDPILYGSSSLLLAGVGLAACFIPARRAARVDPVITLRQD